MTSFSLYYLMAVVLGVPCILGCDRPKGLPYLSFEERVAMAHTAVRGSIKEIRKVPWDEDGEYKDVFITFEVRCVFKSKSRVGPTVTIKEIEPAYGMCFDNLAGLRVGNTATVLIEPDLFEKSKWVFENVNVQEAKDNGYGAGCTPRK